MYLEPIKFEGSPCEDRIRMVGKVVPQLVVRCILLFAAGHNVVVVSILNFYAALSCNCPSIHT